MTNYDSEKTLTVDDAIELASERAHRNFNIKVIGGMRYTQCPCSDHSNSYKIKLFDDGYNCARCGQGGNIPSLFMHLLQNTETIGSGKEAAKIMYGMLRGNEDTPKPKKVKVEVVSEEPETVFDITDISIRDKTYTALLNHLVLSSTDRDNLLERGLSNEDINALEYKTAPRKPKEICKILLNEGHILEGVPGFYKEDGTTWTLRDIGEGFYIPFRNGFGQIQFLQIRTRKKYGDGTRYLSVSSRNFEYGTPAKAWVHIHKGTTPNWWEKIVITEGALKADIASVLSGETFLAVPGVGSLGDLPRALRDLAYLGLKHVTLAYDMDDEENKNVQNGEIRIKKMLDLLEIPYTKCYWDREYKGIDDYLKHIKQSPSN